MKNCLTIDKYEFIQEHKTFKGFIDSKRLLDRSQYFKTIEVEKISAMLPRNWKKSFISGVVIPTKMGFCIECSREKCCDRCNNQLNKNRKLEAKLYLKEDELLTNLFISFLFIRYKFNFNFLNYFNYYILFFLPFFYMR